MKSSAYFNPAPAPYPIRNRIRDGKIFGFFMMGVISSALDISLLYGLTTFLAIWYITAAAFSYCAGIVASYTLNKHLTFHDTNRHYATQFTTFAMISVSCLLINLCIIWLAVELFSLSYLVGKIIATSCAFFWNYHGQRRYTFTGGS